MCVCVFVYVCVLLGSLGLLFEYLFKANYLLDIGAYLLYNPVERFLYYYEINYVIDFLIIIPLYVFY